MSTIAEQLDILIKIREDLAGLNRTNTGLQTTVSRIGDVRAALNQGLNFGLGAYLVNQLASLPARFMQIGQEAMHMAGEIKDSSQQLQMSAESYQVLVKGAEAAGSSQQQLTQSLFTLRRAIAEARADAKSGAANNFRLLELDPKQLAGLQPEMQMESVAVAIGRAKDQQLALNAAVELLGTRAAPRLLEVLQQLSERGFVGLAENIRQQYRIMDQETIDALDRADKRIAAFKNNITTGVGEWLANAFSDDGIGIRIATLQMLKIPAAFGARLIDVLRQFAEFVVTILLAPFDYVARVFGTSLESILLKFRAGVEQTAATMIRYSPAGLTSAGKSAVTTLETRAKNDATVAAALDASISASKVPDFLTFLNETAQKKIQAIQDEGWGTFTNWILKWYNDKIAELKAEQSQVREENEAGQPKEKPWSAMVPDPPPATRDWLKDIMNGLDELIFKLKANIATINADPFKTRIEKQREMLPLLQQENDAIQKTIDLLLEKKNLPGISPTDQELIDQRIDRLRQTQVDVSGDIVKSTPLDWRQQVTAQLVQIKDQFGDTAQQIAAIFTQPVNTAINSITDHLDNFRKGTETLGEAFTNIGRDIVDAFIRMTIQALAFAGVMALVNFLTGGAPMAGGAAGGIFSLFGFAEGGYTGPGGRDEPAGIVHRGEYVMPAHRVSALGVDMLDALRFDRPLPGYAMGGFVGLEPAGGPAGAAAAAGAGGGINLNLGFIGSESEQRRFLQSSAGEAMIVDIFQRHRVKLGLA